MNKAISGAVSTSRPSRSIPRMDSLEYMKLKAENESKPIKPLEGVSEKDEIVASKSKIHTYENIVLPQEGARKLDDSKKFHDPIYINVEAKKVCSTTSECSLLLAANTRII